MDYSSSIGRPGGARSHDGRIGHGYGSIEPSLRSKETSIYAKLPEEEIENYDDEEYLDDIGIVLDKDVRKAIQNAISPYDISAYGVDQSRSDKSALVGNNGILEWADENMPQSRNGMSPFTHKQLYPRGLGSPLGTGGSGQAFKTTGNYRYKGTEKGSSRPHKIMTDIEDENIYDLRDMLDPIDRSWRRQQRAVHKVLNYINEQF